MITMCNTIWKEEKWGFNFDIITYLPQRMGYSSVGAQSFVKTRPKKKKRTLTACTA